MDDASAAPAAGPEKPIHIATRAEQIWREYRNAKRPLKASKLAEMLAAEGFRLVEPRIVRSWITGWLEDDGLDPEDAGATVESMMALSTEILANSRHAITNADLGQIHRGLLGLISVSDAISKRLVEVLPKLEIKSVDEVGKLVDIMGRAAESAEKMSRASDHIRSRAIEQASLHAKSVNDEPMNGEIIPPKGKGAPPPHIMAGLAAFQQKMADAAPKQAG